MHHGPRLSCLLVLLLLPACDPAADGDTAADLCSEEESSPDVIDETQVDTPYPTAAGGSPADGVYHLSRFEVYAPAMADAHTRSERLELTAGTLVSTRQVDQDPAEVSGASFTVEGSVLHLAVSCPEDAAGDLPFTAFADELWLFDPSEPNLKVYTLQ